ncbi:MAG: META domain-containing protein [Bacteroidota bacterium]
MFSCRNGYDITISFDAYNRINIASLCNTYSGHYLLNGPSKLKVGDVLFRLNNCISDTSKQWERECLQNLEVTTGFEITGDILTLFTNASYDLKFRYISENSIEEPTCFDIENNVEDVDLTRKWIFLGYIDDGNHCKPDIDFEMHLGFTNADSLYGQAGNFGSGTYQLFEHDSIDLKFSTYAMYFINDTIRYWDSLFLDNLYDIGWYDIQGRKLKLYNSEMNSLVFVSEE